jgi:hypothetical protein
MAATWPDSSAAFLMRPVMTVAYLTILTGLPWRRMGL